MLFLFFFSSRRRHTRFDCDWSSDVCSSDLERRSEALAAERAEAQSSATTLLQARIAAEEALSRKSIEAAAAEKQSAEAARQRAAAEEELRIALAAQIGRASCRERGYVSVVD